MNNTFVSHAVDDRNSVVIGRFGLFGVTTDDGGVNLLDHGANQGTQAGVVRATLL